MASRQNHETIEAGFGLVDPSFRDVKPNSFSKRRGDKAIPVASNAKTLKFFEESVGAPKVAAPLGDPDENKAGAQDALQHSGAIDEREAVKKELLGLVQSSLLIPDLCKQAGRQCRNDGLWPHMLLRQFKAVEAVAFGRIQSQLLNLSNTEQAPTVNRRKKI